MSRFGSRTASRRVSAQKQGSKRSLNALAIASRQTPDASRSSRVAINARRAQHESLHLKSTNVDQRKSVAPAEDVEYGSDSEGNEWRLGEVGSQDDSEIDSDEALVESDEEEFGDFAFAGSKSNRAREPKRRRLNANDDVSTDGAQVVPEQVFVAGTQSEASWAGLEDSEQERGTSASAASKNQNGSKDDVIPNVDDPARTDIGALEAEMSSQTGSGSDGSQPDTDSDSALTVSDDEDGVDDPNRLSKLHNLIDTMKPNASEQSGRSRRKPDGDGLNLPAGAAKHSTQKLTIEDFLPSVTDPIVRRSLRQLASTKESKSTAKQGGVPGKLEPPLAKRQQDRLDRAAAYGKSKETLERWIDTIKYNRRAEHLSFPLLGHVATSPRQRTEALPRAGLALPNELESTIQNVLQESGLVIQNGMTEMKNIQRLEDEATKTQSLVEAQARRDQLRMARELLFREEIRAKRLKKIKSKSFRRIHRKERERLAETTNTALVAGGFVDEQEEQELNDRRRAEERMGARHQNSKWARAVKAGGRQKWDEHVRMGIAEMAQREESLKKRVQGRSIRSESGGIDSESSSDLGDSQDEDGNEHEAGSRERTKLMEDLDEVAQQHSVHENASGSSRLSSMKFMQRANAARKAENDAAVEKLRRELNGEQSSGDEGPSTIGRRKYQPQSTSNVHASTSGQDRKDEFEEDVIAEGGELAQVEGSEPVTITKPHQATGKKGTMLPRQNQPKAPASGRATTNQQRIRAKDSNSVRYVPSLPVDGATVAVEDGHVRPSNSAKAPKVGNHKLRGTPALRASTAQDDTGAWKSISVNDAGSVDHAENSGGESSHPLTASMTQDELRRRAFAGDEVEKAFAAEKDELMADEDDKVIDNTLPGWGYWVGDGIRKKDQNRNLGRVQTKVEGVNRDKRLDVKLPRTIISEKRVKKVSFLLFWMHKKHPPPKFETLTRYPFPCRIQSTWLQSYRILTRLDISTNDLFDFLSVQSGLPKSLFKLPRSRGLWSSKVSSSHYVIRFYKRPRT